MLKYAIKVDRLQKVITEGDKDYRFGDVLLIKSHLFSRKLIPIDTLTGKQIQKMAMYDNGKFIKVDVNSFRQSGLFSADYTCWYTGEEV